MLCPVIWPFIFRVLDYTYPLVEHGQILCGVHLALQEHHAAVLMLHRMAFHYLLMWLPYISIIVLLKFIYVIEVVQYPFFSF